MQSSLCLWWQLQQVWRFMQPFLQQGYNFPVDVAGYITAPRGVCAVLAVFWAVYYVASLISALSSSAGYSYLAAVVG